MRWLWHIDSVASQLPSVCFSSACRFGGFLCKYPLAREWRAFASSLCLSCFSFPCAAWKWARAFLSPSRLYGSDAAGLPCRAGTDTDAVSPHSSSRVRGSQMQREIKRLKTDLVGHLGHAKGQPRPGAGLPTCVARMRRALRGHAAGSAKEAVSRAGLCPVCSLEPAAQRPQQHRWWDEPGGALCAWLVTKRRKNSWCIHTLGQGAKRGQHRQLCPRARSTAAGDPSRAA